MVSARVRHPSREKALPMSPFGLLVQQWQDRTGQSLRQLALATGVDRSKIAAFMHDDPGNRTIQPDQATALATYMRIPVELVHEAVVLTRGYKLRSPDVPTRLRILLALLEDLTDKQLAVVESTAMAVRDDR